MKKTNKMKTKYETTKETLEGADDLLIGVCMFRGLERWMWDGIGELVGIVL